MIITYTKDLIFRTKLRSVPAKSEIFFVKSLEALELKFTELEVALVILDLTHADQDLYKKVSELKLLKPQVRFVAFASHVDHQNIDLAKKIGINVMFRSQFVKEMSNILNF